MREVSPARSTGYESEMSLVFKMAFCCTIEVTRNRLITYAHVSVMYTFTHTHIYIYTYIHTKISNSSNVPMHINIHLCIYRQNEY